MSRKGRRGEIHRRIPCVTRQRKSMFAENVKMIPKIVTTLACGIFAGAALYISLVEQPARPLTAKRVPEQFDRTRPVSGVMPSAYSKSTTVRRFLP
jgi:hypothetical protein